MAQVILISSHVPPEVHAFLADYIHKIGGNQFLFSRSFRAEGMFAVTQVVSNDVNNKKTWDLHLPLQFVLAVAQMEEDEARSIGFLTP